MNTIETIVSEFVRNYGFSSAKELEINIEASDIMENILSLAESLAELDTSEHLKAMGIIDDLKKWQILYNFIASKK